MRLVYDIETDDLDATKIWCLVTYNIETEEVSAYSDYDEKLPNLDVGINSLSEAELLIGHNIIRFDNYVIDKLYGTNFIEQKSHDTLIMSQVLRYKRGRRHSLKAWGEELGNSKIEYSDFSNYNEDMLKYCIQDVLLNALVYQSLLEEFRMIREANPKIVQGLQIEHDTAVFEALCRKTGFKFDIQKAEKLRDKFQARMKEIEDIIEPQLGPTVVNIDKEPKLPKFKKNGEYTAVTARMLSDYLKTEVTPKDTDMWPAGKPFQREEMKPAKLGSQEILKDWLSAQGWEPDDYNRRKVDGQWISVSPKLTKSSLEKLGEVGLLIHEYYKIRHKESNIRGWLSGVINNHVHGEMITIGTETFRCRHKVIANLPQSDPSNPEDDAAKLRELFIKDDDTMLVGADSAGNQLRAFCHFVGDETFTDQVCDGDVHQFNADILGCDRSTAKTWIYAFLYGAGDSKLGKILTGVENRSAGKTSRDRMSSNIKGLESLKSNILKIWRNTSMHQNNGWIPGLDGRPVFCDAEHRLLNYLIQSTEAITCKAALSYQYQAIKTEELRARPVLFYHDETVWASHPEDSQRVGEILTESFREGPKLFDVMCMDGGDFKIGDTYADVH